MKPAPAPPAPAPEPSKQSEPAAKPEEQSRQDSTAPEKDQTAEATAAPQAETVQQTEQTAPEAAATDAAEKDVGRSAGGAVDSPGVSNVGSRRVSESDMTPLGADETPRMSVMFVNVKASNTQLQDSGDGSSSAAVLEEVECAPVIDFEVR